eukprot:TRINITY_DN3318_c0_g1_i1.p1 TRINITY_DN3318_c0_g1~~TRINITY_DN3318_c0_g1_i1.p1  ORF type:complete len:720 (-),score=194.55 TRINITY_DN3318_c0_g1_i1:72-2195(-)
MDELLQAFPELGRSMISDVFKSVDNDVTAAKEVLMDFATKDPSNDLLERMLTELEPFKELGRDVLVSTLRECEWDVDNAMLPLFNKLEKLRSEERAKTYEAERKARAQKAKLEANAFLRELFRALPEDKIQELLDANDGDVDATTDELFQYVATLDERAKKAEEEKDRQRNIENLVIRFGFSQEEVRDVLLQAGWDLGLAVPELVKREAENKISEFVILYPILSEEEIRSIAVLECYDMLKAQTTILMRVREKREELERQKREEEERLRRLEEALQKQKEDAERRALEEEEARNNAKLREEMEMRHREEEMKRKIEEEARLQLEAEERERKEREEKNRKTELEKALKAAQVLLLEQSIKITKEMVEANNKTAFQDDVRKLVKQELEDKMRQCDLPGLQQSNEVKVDRVELQESQKEEHKPDPVSDVEPVNKPDSDIVKLKLSPERVDFGKALNVEWEHSAEPTVRDWIALYADGKSGRDYVTYEWVSQRKGAISFSAPHTYGNYHVCYFTNGSYETYGVSNSVAVGPLYDFRAELNGNDIVVNVEPQTGTPCAQAWVAMYSSNSSGLGDYYTYQWVGDNKKLTFQVPKTASWNFKLFPHKTLNPVASCDVEVKGENKLSVSVEGNLIHVNYSVATLDPSRDKIWIGIYFCEEGNQRQFRRRKVIGEKEGIWTCKKMIHKGIYEARLFACGTYEVRERSAAINIDEGL